VKFSPIAARLEKNSHRAAIFHNGAIVAKFAVSQVLRMLENYKCSQVWRMLASFASVRKFGAMASSVRKCGINGVKCGVKCVVLFGAMTYWR
jgi:hypothetical protein